MKASWTVQFWYFLFKLEIPGNTIIVPSEAINITVTYWIKQWLYCNISNWKMSGFQLYVLVCSMCSFGTCISNPCEHFQTKEQCVLCTKSTNHDCYGGGDDTELLKYHSYYYQQKFSILPPRNDSCYFNISFYQNSFATSNFDDRLYISQTLSPKSCSQYGKWSVDVEPEIATVVPKIKYFRLRLKHAKGRHLYATTI